MLWWTALALAGVTVDDDSGCLDEEAVRLEVGQVLDALDARGIDVTVAMGEGAVQLRVDERHRRLWERTLPVEAADCPALPGLVGRSVEQGLVSLPGWDLRGEGPAARPPADLTVLLEVAASPTRSPLGWGVLGVGSGALGPRARWVAGLGLVAGAVSDGEGRGAQLLAPLVRLGPATDLGRAGAWRLGGMVSAGPVFVAPQAAVQLSGPSVVPGARAEASLTWSGRGALAIGAFVDAPLIRVVVVDMSEDRRLSEGIVRAGIRVGVGGELGRSE